MLVAAGVAAVGVALGVADENGNVAVKDILVHENGVTPLGGAQIHHVLIVFTVVGGDLVGPVELVEHLLAQNLLHLSLGGTGVQTVGEQQQDVFLADTAGIQLVETCTDGNLPVGSGLAAALDDVRNDEDNGLAGGSQFLQCRHTHGVADALQCLIIQGIPVLGQALGIGDGGAGDKYVGVVRQLSAHQALAILKIQFHSPISLLQIGS